MKRRSLSKFIETSELEPLHLRDTAVVIDAYSFFYDSYKDSGLHHTFGCESDRYADYLREYLSMFKKANLKCYFVFKGENKIRNFPNSSTNSSTAPIFFRSVYKEVLDEMEFDYVHCEFESKIEIIALAQKLKCPIICFDVEFCTSGQQNISKYELIFNEDSKAIDCRYFSFPKFLQKYNLTATKAALLLVLTDECMFPQNFLYNFFNSQEIPMSSSNCIPLLLEALSKRNGEWYLSSIFNSLPEKDGITFYEEHYKVRQLIERQETGGLASETLLNRDVACVGRADPLWFLKGVIAGHIATDYINLYHNGTFFGSDVLYSNTNQEAMVLSVGIVSYAFDLLTNFTNDGFLFYYDDYYEQGYSRYERIFFVVGDMYNTVPKPNYEANVCVFENGWIGLRKLGLLEHFLNETYLTSDIDLESLDRLPEDARLLIVALIYFARSNLHSNKDTSAEVVSILLSYVTLGVVFDKADKSILPEPPFPRKPTLNSSTDKSTVSAVDCSIAAAIMEEYCTVSKEFDEIFYDDKIMYPIVQFQLCLSQFTALNSLCGAPFPPPAFSRSYNGTLVYNILSDATSQSSSNRHQFLSELLSPAPTVYAFLNGLIEIYKENFGTYRVDPGL